MILFFRLSVSSGILTRLRGTPSNRLEEHQIRKFDTKYGSATKSQSFILSQSKCNNKIEEEAKANILNTLGTKNGVTIVDSREGLPYGPILLGLCY